MPRTYSDLLQIDSMTARKAERYGAQIMCMLKEYWNELDGNLCYWIWNKQNMNSYQLGKILLFVTLTDHSSNKQLSLKSTAREENEIKRQLNHMNTNKDIVGGFKDIQIDGTIAPTSG